MRWVKEIFPPRPRPRWLLITIRLSTRSLAGTARTLVAVGTARLAAMFTAVRAAAPRSLTVWSASGAGLAAGAAGVVAGAAVPGGVVSGGAVADGLVPARGVAAGWLGAGVPG